MEPPNIKAPIKLITSIPFTVPGRIIVPICVVGGFGGDIGQLVCHYSSWFGVVVEVQLFLGPNMIIVGGGACKGR